MGAGASSLGKAGAVGFALAMTLMVCTACGHSKSTSSGTPSSAAAPTTVAHDPAQYLPGPCPATPQPEPELQTAHCAVLVVPENRSKPGGRTLRLPVAIIPSETQPAAADPIVFLYGGPGGDAILNAPGSEGPGFNHNRDVILMSQRGTHSAQPVLTCPEIDQFFARRVGLVYDAPSTGDEYVKAVKACHDRLAGGADLSAFNSIESAYDLIDLRNALRINQWNVFSHSYGTELALIYARMDRQGMRSLALDGLTPPSLASPAWTWGSAREAFDNMMAACTAQPACQASYPGLGDTIVGQLNQLEAHPVTTTVKVEGVGDTKVVIDGGALFSGWLVPLGTHFPADVPAAIDELVHGNPTRIAQRLANTYANPNAVGIMAWALTLSVWCSEWIPFESEADQLQAARHSFAALPDSMRAQAPQLPFLRKACEAWNVPAASEWVRGVTDSDVPVLVLSGSYDGQTSPASGQYVAQRLSHSTVVTVPGVAHGIYVDPCGAAVIDSFFNNPQQPDTGCVNTTHPPDYSVDPRPCDRAKPSTTLTSILSFVSRVAHYCAMRRVLNAEWEPTVPALLQMVAAAGAPRLRVAFAAAGLDGIRPAQAVALVPLATGGLHASDLADRLGVSRQAVAQAVAALDRNGYVTRGPNPDDARAQIIELTPRGRQALRVMRSNALDVQKRWQQTLGPQRFDELRTTLRMLIDTDGGADA